MGAQAGPSNLLKSKKAKGKAKKPVNAGKIKKTTEKQRLADLEKAATEFVAPADLKSFNDLPISEPTKRGLKKAFFKDMTDIQAKSLPESLKGKDILGAARTGSGKTLAFLIPVLEILYRRKWGPSDGLGALIISPTRELAVQIFEVLRSIGGYHSFSAGLVIGGKQLKDERDRLSRMNILVATPGRLLQHMDQTVGFESDNLQMLVLDEADRILDMGFQRTLNALISHLPKSRQTLLFSATQTDSVSSLARLSLKSPVTVSTMDPNSHQNSIPASLSQHYLLCPLDQKLSVLWSFLKTHLTSKLLVFLSSCKQVRFVYETFCRLHPGIPLLHMHGKMKQSARLSVYDRFTKMSHAAMFATDVAARGLDFPAIDWVVQVDVPEDAETYIHRVGRTARYESKGNALMFVMPSEEEGIKAALDTKGISVGKIKPRASKTQNIDNQLQNLAFQDTDIKYLGQRAFVSYLRSIYLHKDKAIFKLEELPVDRFAESLGLPGAPKIKFLGKEIAKKKKNASRSIAALQAEIASENATKDGESDDGASSGDEGESSDGEDSAGVVEAVKDAEPEAIPPKSEKPTVRTKYDRMFERKNQKFEHHKKLLDHGDDVSEGDDFITLKREDHGLSSDSEEEHKENMSKRKLKLSKAKRVQLKSAELGSKLVFDDEGNAHEMYEMADAEEFFKAGPQGVKDAGRKFVEGERGWLMVADVADKEEAKDKKREKKRKRKEREKAELDGDDDGPGFAVVAPMLDDDGYLSPGFDLPSESEDEEDLPPPPKKRSKQELARPHPSRTTLEDEEELALQLLRQR
ncbi:hypothetical protein HWV62_14240 [Athelia sp. TMB]|nr:hypothetical protein HWV62_28330 [Athelia sp. TMB]KAF7973772.1 hypothetical protein HWV62_14240 [Athelia sp. TMB]